MTPSYTKRNSGTIESPVIETIKINVGRSGNIPVENNVILFVLEGEMVFSYNGYEDCAIKKGNLIALPLGCSFQYITKAAILIIMVRITDDSLFSDFYLSDNLESEKKSMLEGSLLPELPHYISINSPLYDYLNDIVNSEENRLQYLDFHETKIRELSSLLRNYYSGYELARLFCLCYSPPSFAGKIINNYHKYNTAMELAGAMGYSFGGFGKRFKKLFGMSAYKWMKQQKANRIYHELKTGSLYFKELAYMYGFAGPSQLNDFCRKNFGLTPKKIRDTQSKQKKVLKGAK